MRKKIAMIIPYFGKWPIWMNFYLHSCSKNSTIMDILLFSDIPFDSNWNIPVNVKFIHTTFSDYCKRISGALNMSFTPNSPYKLCDIKPFYGYIHEKELKGYDFWGFGDIDLIYGNLGEFINEKLLNKYDYISAHGDRVAGHFFLVRNNSKFNRKVFKIKNWQKLLEDNKYRGVDESRFLDVLAPFYIKIQKLKNGVIKKLQIKPRRINLIFYNRIADFTRFIFGFKCKRLYFKERYSTPSKEWGFSMEYLYDDGKIIDLDINKEIMYLHFLGYKKELWQNENAKLKIDTQLLINKNVLINETGFHIVEK